MKYLTFRLNQSQTCHHVLSYIAFEEEKYRNTAILKQNKKSKMFFFTPQIWNTHQLPTTSQPAILKRMVHLSQANIKQMSQLGLTPNHNGATNVTDAPYQSLKHILGTVRTLP